MFELEMPLAIVPVPPAPPRPPVPPPNPPPPPAPPPPVVGVTPPRDEVERAIVLLEKPSVDEEPVEPPRLEPPSELPPDDDPPELEPAPPRDDEVWAAAGAVTAS